MSAILQKLTNYVQSQSHRVYPENWMGDDWLPVPPEFEAIAVANAPYIDVIYSDDGRTITNIIPTEKPEPEPEPEPTPDPIQKLEQENALLKQQVQALTEQAAFHEEIFVELAEVIYA